MKILSKEETRDHANALGLPDQGADLLSEQYPFHAAFVLPVDTGKKTGLALDLAKVISKSPPGLIWVTEFGVWASSENPDLFNGYRASLGETRPLIQAPGHIFDESDTASVGSILSMVLYFFWDAFLIEGSGETVVHVSHDEYVDFWTRTQERLHLFTRIAERLEMEPIVENEVKDH